MKTKYLAAWGLSALCTLAPINTHAQNVDTMPPVVVKTTPEAGSKDVDPALNEIKVTFSKPMMDKSWSWSTAWQNSDAQSSEKPAYEADQKTCVLKVKLEPGKTYGYWINSQKFLGFKDKGGRSAVPYLLTFRTATQKTDK